VRDTRGRWLPGPTEDDGRHFLSLLDRQKGFEAAMLRGKLPSRLRAWLRNKIRRYYAAKRGKKTSRK
jgi:hypothetical protein